MKTRNQRVILYSLPKANRNGNLDRNEGGEIFNALLLRLKYLEHILCFPFHALIMINYIITKQQMHNIFIYKVKLR